MYTKSDTTTQEMTENLSFGTWLRQRRRNLDLTQQAFADQVGCARITLSRIEANTLKPSKELALILLEKLSIPELERSQWIQFARGLVGFPAQPDDSFKTQPPSNLPAALSSFIGRIKEQAAILKLIHKHRLVTLTGTGGVGKMRLALQVGEQGLGNYANGVWVVELASLNDPALLPHTVAAVFGIATQSNTPYTELLTNFLRTKSLLIILDNCEHLLEACARLADALLKSCPNLKILATSREALGVPGEAIYGVPSLGLPDLQQVLEGFREYESVRLFEERAQLVQTDFTLTIKNASSVAQICHRLDGIPLAIELAAVQVNMLSTEQIAAQLDECFRILTGGSRTVLPRHQTIRASMDWSWNLLTDSESTLLRRLSIFAGSWTLEAAESVCSGKGIAPNQVLYLMTQLVKKSLVSVKQETGRETRYHFHEMIRQYAHEKLRDASEEGNIRTQHLKYFLTLSEEIEPGLWGSQQVVWFARTRDELDDLRKALTWADKTDVEAGLYIASNLGQFWLGFQLNEGVQWLTQFLQHPNAERFPKAKAKATRIQGHLLADMEKDPPNYEAIENGLKFYRASGDQHGEIDSLLLLAQLVVGNRSSEFIQQALTLARSDGDKWREARALQAMSWNLTDHALARTCWNDAIALYRQVGDWRRLASLQSATANYLILDGDLVEAQKLLEEASAINKLLNNKELSANILFSYGNMALLQGEYDRARTNFQQHVTIHVEIGQELDWATSRLGYVALREGNLTGAHEILAKTVQNFYNHKNKLGLVSTFEILASLYIQLNKLETAVVLISWADKVREELGATRWRVEQVNVDGDIATCLEQLGEASFADAYEEGKKIELDAVVKLALEDIAL